MAESGSLPMPIMRPRRSGFLPSLAGIIGATSAVPRSGARSLAVTPPLMTAPMGFSPAARAPVEVWRKARRFRLLIIVTQKSDFGIVLGNECSLLLPNENVLPPHLHASTGVNLQANHAIGEFRRRIRKVHDLHAIELRHDVVALYGHFEVIPLAGLQCPLTFHCRHRPPTPASAFIQSTRMLANVWVHLYLHPLNVRAMFRI